MTGKLIEIYAILNLIILCAYFVKSPEWNILSLRQILIIPLFLIVGSLFQKYLKIEAAFKIIIVVCTIVAFSGYIERFFLFDKKETFWNLFDFKSFQESKGLGGWGVNQVNVPIDFYTFDFGGRLRRMTSIFIAEPILLAHFLVLPAFFSLLSKKYLKFIYFIIPIIFTFGKGGILSFSFAYLFYLLQNAKSNFVKFAFILFVCSATGGAIYSAYAFPNFFGSIVLHLAGLFSNFPLMLDHPFGLGLGVIGNFANLNESSETLNRLSLSSVGESYLGTMIGQTGIFGLALFVFLFIIVLKINLNNSDHIRMAIKYVVLGTMFSSIASESAISYIGSGYLFMLLPFAFTYKKKIVIYFDSVIQSRSIPQL